MIRQIKLIILGFGLVGMLFGYMGAFTDWGTRHYDEMDAIMPFFILVLSGIVVAIMFVILGFDFFYKKKQK